MNGKVLRSGPVKILRIHRNQRRNINKGSKDQTGASALSHDKASSTMEKQRHQFSHKIKIYKSPVLSILLYGCESWTLTADLERRIQAVKNKCCRRMFSISYREHKTNEYVWQQVNILGGRQELLLSTIKHRMLSWFGHVCHHDTLKTRSSPQW